MILLTLIPQIQTLLSSHDSYIGSLSYFPWVTKIILLWNMGLSLNGRLLVGDVLILWEFGVQKRDPELQEILFLVSKYSRLSFVVSCGSGFRRYILEPSLDHPPSNSSHMRAYLEVHG